MANTYVNYITDEHFLKCIESLYKSYLRAKNNISKMSFYYNKVDTVVEVYTINYFDVIKYYKL